MRKPMLILMLTFIAAVGMSGLATAQLVNVTVNGSNDPILSPTLNQTQDQAQAQAQTSNNTNTNNLTNTNVNIPISTSSATNNVSISNNNTFNPVIITSNVNRIGAISVRSINNNVQAQLSRSSFSIVSLKRILI